MGLRFRRSWGVIPGVRFNLGLRGGSVSFGTRGLHYTVGSSGSRITAGLPGTGLFWTQKLNSPFVSPPSSKANHPQSYLPPARGGAQPSGGRQAQAPALPGSFAPTLGQLRQPSVPPPPTTVATQSFAPPHRHVFVSAWLVWSTLAVIAIGALCTAAAVLGALFR